MIKQRLLTPGPTAVPETVLSKFAEPMVHHRTSLFEAQFKQLRGQLKWIFQTQSEVLSLACTGTGAMEAAVTNLFTANDSVVVVVGGKFGERWGEIAQAYGVSVIEIQIELGKSLDPSELDRVLSSSPQVKAVLFQASETSTGALMPVQEIAKICQKHSVLSVCDGITAVGIFDVPMDEWKIDVLMTGSQKALMLPPGLAFIALSDRAWKAVFESKLPKFYFDLQKEKQVQVKNQTAWTPAISLIQGAVTSLELLQKRGLDAIFKHHERLAHATRSAMEALGLSLFAEHPSSVLTSVLLPESLSEEKRAMVSQIMQEKYGVIVAGGQGELKGKILRFSHFGHTDIFDVISGISAFEFTLLEIGYSLKLGQGVSAAQVAYHHGR